MQTESANWTSLNLLSKSLWFLLLIFYLKKKKKKKTLTLLEPVSGSFSQSAYHDSLYLTSPWRLWEYLLICLWRLLTPQTHSVIVKVDETPKATLAIDVTLPKSKVSCCDLCFELPEVALRRMLNCSYWMYVSLSITGNTWMRFQNVFAVFWNNSASPKLNISRGKKQLSVSQSLIFSVITADARHFLPLQFQTHVPHQTGPRASLSTTRDVLFPPATTHT